jgi:hypothetical protein
LYRGREVASWRIKLIAQTIFYIPPMFILADSGEGKQMNGKKKT